MPAYVLTQWCSDLRLAGLLCFIALPPVEASENLVRSSTLIELSISGAPLETSVCDDIPPPKAPAPKAGPENPAPDNLQPGDAAPDAPQIAVSPEAEADFEPPKGQHKADANHTRSILEERYTKLVHRELEFIRIASQAQSAELEPVRVAFDNELKQALKSRTTSRGLPFLFGAVAVSTAITPEKRLLRKLRVQAKSILGQEKADRIKREEDLRLANRKQAVVLNLVNQLDNRLSLSPTQRDQLIESVGKWKSAGQISLVFFASEVGNDDPDFRLPDIPNQFVDPFLNLEQKEIWRGIGRVDPLSIESDLEIQDEFSRFMEVEKDAFEAEEVVVGQGLEDLDVMVIDEPAAMP